MKSLNEVEALLDELEAGKMTRNEFYQRWLDLTPEEATERERIVDESWATEQRRP